MNNVHAPPQDVDPLRIAASDAATPARHWLAHELRRKPAELLAADGNTYSLGRYVGVSLKGDGEASIEIDAFHRWPDPDDPFSEITTSLDPAVFHFQAGGPVVIVTVDPVAEPFPELVRGILSSIAERFPLMTEASSPERRRGNAEWEERMMHLLPSYAPLINQAWDYHGHPPTIPEVCDYHAIPKRTLERAIQGIPWESFRLRARGWRSQAVSDGDDHKLSGV